MPKIYAAKPTVRLWATLRIWAWLFMAAAVAMALAYAYRAMLFAQMPSNTFIVPNADIPGHPEDIMIVGLASIFYLVTYVAGAYLVLIWFMRSIRNGHALGFKFETSPKWVIWFFVLPIVSLFKPYTMASELWRSSTHPERWKSAKDPAFLRVWWGAALTSGLALTIGDILSRMATVPSTFVASAVVLVLGYLLQIAAGVLFLRLSGPISQRQTLLIDAAVFSDAPETTGHLA